MCIISKKLKFCTCVNTDIEVEDLNHYWVLNRYNKRKKTFILGEIVMPYSFIKANFKENELVISKALTEKDTFDTAIAFKDKDVLQVFLYNHSKNHEGRLAFKFVYEAGKWQGLDGEDPFYFLNYCDEINYGEIIETLAK